MTSTDREDLWRRVRSDFPYASECVYLNTAAAGLSWRGQGAAAARFYDDAKAHGYNGMEEWRTTTAGVRASLARLLNVDTHEIRFVASTTDGLNLVASALECRAGDNIVVAQDEFPSVLLACERAARSGATIRMAYVPSESEREAALINAITPATRMLVVSHVHWATGTRVDLTRLGAECDRVGAHLVVDGVQALGAVPMELGDTAAYCASVFKWLLSGFGLGIVVVRDRIRGQLSPAFRGYNNPPPSTDLQQSHVNYPGIYALGASLEFLETIGWSAVFTRVRELTDALTSGLERIDVPVVTPSHTRAGIVSCRVSDADRVRDALAAREIYVESREGLLRISPHLYNTTDDIDAFVSALADIEPSPS